MADYTNIISTTGYVANGVYYPNVNALTYNPNYINPNYIWSNWTSGTAATVTITQPQLIWNAWNTTTADTTMVWNNWFNQPYQNGTIGGMLTTQTWRDTRTPEQRAADEERARVQRAEYEERLAKEHAESAKAVERAETLLHSFLRPGQRRMLRLRSRFYVRSQHGKRYEIERGHHANVFEVDGKGKRLNRLCVYAVGGVPEADCMLAQKLHLEMDEDQFLRTAHVTRL